MNSLTVWLHGESVAELRSDRRSQLALQYDAETVSRCGADSVCLSVALPVRSRTYTGDRVEAWVEGLLPEGEMRTVLERRFGVRRGDAFALLAELGRDCAGAVSFTPAGAKPPDASQPEPLSPDGVAREIAGLPERPLGADIDVRVSLGGLQAKLLLVRTGAGGWARPTGGTPSTHLLKPDPPAYPGLVVCEAFVMTAARLAGLEAADVELDEIDGRPVLIVERFDRRRDGDRLVRLHQEDGCQALGLDPARKYQDLRDLPSYSALATVLADHALDPKAEWRRLGAAMTLTVAVGNADGHARNHGLLLADGMVRLAPLYDVASTTAFVAGRQLALWIAGQARMSAVTVGHLVDEMRSWGLSVATARTVAETTLDRLLTAYPEAAAATQVDASILADCAQRTRALLAGS